MTAKVDIPVTVKLLGGDELRGTVSVDCFPDPEVMAYRFVKHIGENEALALRQDVSCLVVIPRSSISRVVLTTPIAAPTVSETTTRED